MTEEQGKEASLRGALLLQEPANAFGHPGAVAAVLATAAYLMETAAKNPSKYGGLIFDIMTPMARRLRDAADKLLAVDGEPS